VSWVQCLAQNPHEYTGPELPRKPRLPKSATRSDDPSRWPAGTIKIDTTGDDKFTLVKTFDGVKIKRLDAVTRLATNI
jgi:hypothetical protein